MSARPGRRRLFAAVLAAALAAAGTQARAAAQGAQQTQATANLNASVTVAAPPLVFVSTRDLEFGPVAPGQTVSVPAQPPYPSLDTWAAAFRFENLRKNVDYAVWFTLPATLQNGTSTIPVTYAGTQYGWICVYRTMQCDSHNQVLSPAAHTSPGTAYTLDIPNNTPGNGFTGDFFVGGRIVVPAAPLRPGTYTAPLTITIAPIN